MQPIAPWLRNFVIIPCLVLVLVSLQWPTSWLALVCGRPGCFVFGGWQLIDCLLILRRRVLVKRYGIRTTGQLVKLQLHGRWLKPVVTFMLEDGRTVVVEVQQSVNFDWHIRPLPPAAQRPLEITYNPYQPQEAFLYSSASIWLGPLVGIALSLVMLIIVFVPWPA